MTRTVATKVLVITQWIFTETNSGALAAPIFEVQCEPTDFGIITPIFARRFGEFGSGVTVV